MDAENSEVTPPWGSLPVEQYLIRKWDPTSPLPPAEQRAELVKAFIEEDNLPAELFSFPPPRLPTAEEVQTVLAPWRPQKLRRIAARLMPADGEGCKQDFLFLRTYYAGGEADDAKLREWLEADEPEGLDLAPADLWWMVLDDEGLFGHLDGGGDDWLGVYETLPELAAPRRVRAFTEDDVEYARTWTPDPALPEWEVYEEDYEEAVQQAACRSVTWLIVIDKEAFETDEVGFIFRDKKGNIVRESSVRFDQLYGDWILWMVRGNPRATYSWGGSVPRKKYKSKGRIMRELLPRVKGESAVDTSNK